MVFYASFHTAIPVAAVRRQMHMRKHGVLFDTRQTRTQLVPRCPHLRQANKARTQSPCLSSTHTHTQTPAVTVVYMLISFPVFQKSRSGNFVGTNFLVWQKARPCCVAWPRSRVLRAAATCPIFLISDPSFARQTHIRARGFSALPNARDGSVACQRYPVYPLPF
jgi:hypothetical protein